MNRLKKLRCEKGLTLKKVASDNDLAESQLSFYENGKRAPRDNKTWEKLANYFNVSVSYLMGLSKQRISEKRAITVAKEVYFSYFSDDSLDDDVQVAIKYFNNDELDNILLQAMQQYFTIPFVEWNPEQQSLENIGFLYSWLEGYLVDRYRKEVRTNQNLITNTYYNIPSFDDINEYGRLEGEIQLPIEKDFYRFFKNDSFSAEVHEEIEKLIKTNTTLIAYHYESSVDDELKDDINKILDDARSKIYSLKEKYPDKPSKLEQATILISKDENSSLWSRVGSSDFKDEINISETTKQIFIQIASEFIKALEIQSKNNDNE